MELEVEGESEGSLSSRGVLVAEEYCAVEKRRKLNLFPPTRSGSGGIGDGGRISK